MFNHQEFYANKQSSLETSWNFSDSQSWKKMDQIPPYNENIDMLPEIVHEQLMEDKVSSQIYTRLEKHDIVSWDRKLAH